MKRFVGSSGRKTVLAGHAITEFRRTFFRELTPIFMLMFTLVSSSAEPSEAPLQWKVCRVTWYSAEPCQQNQPSHISSAACYDGISKLLSYLQVTGCRYPFDKAVQRYHYKTFSVLKIVWSRDAQNYMNIKYRSKSSLYCFVSINDCLVHFV